MLTPLRFFFAALLVSLVACGGGGGNSAAVGTWKLDGEATAGANEALMGAEMEGQPEEMREMMVNMMKQMLAQADVSMTIKADGTMSGVAKFPNPITGEAKEDKMTGSWSMDGNTVTMKTKDDAGKEQTQTASLDGDKMTATMDQDGQEMTMVFRKQ